MADYGVRKYDSFTGRFMTADVLFEKFPAWNPYHYSLNNPISYRDGNGMHPSGSEFWRTNVSNEKVAEQTKNVVLGVASWTDLNDITVLGTKALNSIGILKNAYNIDGTVANNTDVAFAAVGMVIPYAAGSLLNKASDGASYIYRAVSKDELDDIIQSGFRNKEGGYETGKLFAPTIEEAAQFGKNNYQLDGLPVYIMRVEIPNSVIDKSYRFSADGMNAISVPAEELKNLDGSLINFAPLKK